MTWNGNDTDHGPVAERGFTIECEGREVPGVYWTPTAGGAGRLVMLGHGGTGHKKIENIAKNAHDLAALGVASFAIDGPCHGDRPGARELAEDASFARRWHTGGGTAPIVADWSAALDFIESADEPRPTGWLGLSMGTMMGLPVCVADERVKVAVLGLMGTWGPNADDLAAMAPQLSIPVRFMVQWDDEVVPRDDCLALYDLLGTSKKTMHVNPGAHAAVPTFEMVAAADYLSQQLSKLG